MTTTILILVPTVCIILIVVQIRKAIRLAKEDKEMRKRFDDEPGTFKY